jgi:hypothetical protein
LEPAKTKLNREVKSAADRPAVNLPVGQPEYTRNNAQTTGLRFQPEHVQKNGVDFNPVNMLSQALWSDINPSTASKQSMVTQVDAILQEKLDMAGMKKWAVRLAEFPQRGMVVLVGLEQYDGIDAVPYERVRRIIRESVSEWEQRSYTGSIVL